MRLRLLSLAACVLFLGSSADAAVRIKDITTIEGQRGNQLYGVGLVVGLANTGGRSLATQQMAIDMLHKLNISTKIARQQLQDNVFLSTNISIVSVTAELPPFARRGSRIDVVVSVMDDAFSLQGGTLLMTPLRGADGEAYAVAQGPVSIGGFRDQNAAQGSHINHANVARIPQGAFVEREELGCFHQLGRMRLLLLDPDYSTSRSIAAAINEKYHHTAVAIDAGTVEVHIPKALSHKASDFTSEIGLLLVQPDTPARIIINERTGTVIVGEHVQISPVAIAHQGLNIRPAPPPPPDPLGPAASLLGLTPQNQQQQQPGFGGLGAQAPPRGTVLNPVDRSTTVAELARAMNALGVNTRDLISIFQSLKESGALHADLVVR